MSKCGIDFKAHKCEFCSDCIHGHVCMWRAYPQDPTEHCQFFKDKSLFVELPCRCKDCEYSEQFTWWDGKKYRACTITDFPTRVEDDGFCNYAQLRAEAEKKSKEAEEDDNN